MFHSLLGDVDCFVRMEIFLKQGTLPLMKYWNCVLHNMGKFPCFTVCRDDGHL